MKLNKIRRIVQTVGCILLGLLFIMYVLLKCGIVGEWSMYVAVGILVLAVPLAVVCRIYCRCPYCNRFLHHNGEHCPRCGRDLRDV